MSQSVFVRCRRDRRYKVKEPIAGTSCTVDHYVKRRLQDLPVSGRSCTIEVELTQTRDKERRRLIEETEYVAKGGRYTARFCNFISGLCRHMSIHNVSQHLGIRWETVKNIDREYLRSSKIRETTRKPPSTHLISKVGYQTCIKCKRDRTDYVDS
ncbi:Transposase IS204/IS1001/IS1096/IS1165 helix-turn-helix domain-containing protein [Vibrio aquimaris]|uniref:Transposase IS204/IS1001/IS1096/IS1165 helix-turn-helix domain-containing protein n=1 Tax=Vibrio aquimaris TaxID=2587862 RepID=A0A5P9CMT2_9VIBR|nr:hypothetical protein FIV01_11400 [Vibrio aquimaris]